MKNFVVLYYSPPEAMAKMGTSSPEEMKSEQQKWMDWFKSLGDNLVDMGEYFGKSANLSKDGWNDASGKVTGYSIIQAESFDEAKKMISSHPHVGWFEGCNVDLHEPMEMGQ